jgi:GT2 family glycosyltransferase
MINFLKGIARRFFVAGRSTTTAKPVPLEQAKSGITLAPFGKPIAEEMQNPNHDIELMQQSRMSWELGDWQKLANIGCEELEAHPQRADLMLLKATALIQLGHFDEGKQAIEQASAWGVDRRLIAQVLVRGTHNNLGRAAVNIGSEQRSINHFKSSTSAIILDSATTPIVGPRYQTQKNRPKIASTRHDFRERNINASDVNNEPTSTFTSTTITSVWSNIFSTVHNKTSTPQISIILPFHNNAEYIRKCIESIAQQTYMDFEVVLVDDGSTDDSAKIATSVCQNTHLKWKLVKHRQNRGVASARNTGIKYASGDFILFVDSDDFIAIDSLEILMRHAADHDIVRGSVITYAGNDKKIDLVTDQILSGQAPTALPIAQQQKFFYGLTAMLFRRSFFVRNELKFNEKLQNAEDTYFLIDAFLAASKVAIVPHFVYYYCRRPKSLSNPSKPNLIYFLNIISRLKYMATRFKEANLCETSAIAFQTTWKYYLEPDIIPLAETSLEESDLKLFRSRMDDLCIEFQNQKSPHADHESASIRNPN